MHSPLHLALASSPDQVHSPRAATAVAYCLWKISSQDEAEIMYFHNDLAQLKTQALSLGGLSEGQKNYIANYQ